MCEPVGQFICWRGGAGGSGGNWRWRSGPQRETNCWTWHLKVTADPSSCYVGGVVDGREVEPGDGPFRNRHVLEEERCRDWYCI